MNLKYMCLKVGIIQANCYIVMSDSGEGFVVDPGTSGAKIVSELESHNIKPKYIILTHGHYDHIGAAVLLREKYSAKICVGAGDWDMLGNPVLNHGFFCNSNMGNYCFEADIKLYEGDRLEVGNLNITVIETPGHSLGGICLLCGNLLFSGDTLFAGDVGRTDLYGGSYDQLINSVNKLAKLDPKIKVLPGHGHSTTIGDEIRNNL